MYHVLVAISVGKGKTLKVKKYCFGKLGSTSSFGLISIQLLLMIIANKFDHSD